MRIASPAIIRRVSSLLCLQTAVHVTSYQRLPICKKLNRDFSLMRHPNHRLTSRNSNTTTVITRGCRACFVIVVRTIHRNRRYRAKRTMRLAQAVTHNSSQIRRVRSAPSVTRMCRAERSKLFHRCAVSMSGSITRSTLALLVPHVIGVTAMASGSPFHQD